MANKYLIIESCLKCPFYKEENNVFREGEVGYTSECSKLGKEIAFTDKSETPDIYERPHRECPLDNY